MILDHEEHGDGALADGRRRRRRRWPRSPPARAEAGGREGRARRRSRASARRPPTLAPLTGDPVRMYLKEIGKVPLLTAAQEVDPREADRGRPRGRRAARGRAEEAGKKLDRAERAPPAAHRGRRPGRQAAARRGQPAPRRLDRQALRRPRDAVPRPHPGGQPRPDPRRREVRLHARASSSPPTRRGGSARPSPARIADQARTIRIPVHMVETINKLIRVQRQLLQELGREPTAEEIGARDGDDAPSACARSSRSRRSRSRSRRRSARRRTASSATSSRTPRRSCRRRRRASRCCRSSCGEVLDVAVGARAQGHRAALRPRGRASAHARGGRPRVRRHARAHPADRDQDAVQAAPPVPQRAVCRTTWSRPFRTTEVQVQPLPSAYPRWDHAATALSRAATSTRSGY